MLDNHCEKLDLIAAAGVNNFSTRPTKAASSRANSTKQNTKKYTKKTSSPCSRTEMWSFLSVVCCSAASWWRARCWYILNIASFCEDSKSVIAFSKFSLILANDGPFWWLSLVNLDWRLMIVLLHVNAKAFIGCRTLWIKSTKAPSGLLAWASWDVDDLDTSSS